MASTCNEEGQILKKHIISTEVVETIEVNGLELQERKHQVIIKASKNESLDPKMTEVTHSRSISDYSKFFYRSYAVQWNTPEGKDENRIVKTKMTQEEVQRFEEDWCTLWNTLAKAD